MQHSNKANILFLINFSMNVFYIRKSILRSNILFPSLMRVLVSIPRLAKRVHDELWFRIDAATRLLFHVIIFWSLKLVRDYFKVHLDQSVLNWTNTSSMTYIFVILLDSNIFNDLSRLRAPLRIDFFIFQFHKLNHYFQNCTFSSLHCFVVETLGIPIARGWP